MLAWDSARVGFVALVLLAGCQPAAFPRSAEIADEGDVSAEVHLQTVGFEPQRATLTDGRTLSSKLAVFPIIAGGVRGSIGRCELGGLYALTRIGPEARCGLLGEKWGDPISVAFSGAGAIDYGGYVGAFGRLGLDVSRRAGPVTAMVDIYLSTANGLRWMVDPGNIPIEGPLPGSASVLRRENRLTVPVGIGIDLAQPGKMLATLVLGANPYFVIAKGACRDHPCTASWSADRGAAITVGMEFHARPPPKTW